MKQPWASLIAEGKKTVEVRSQVTKKIGERIAIYASTSAWDKGTIDVAHNHLSLCYPYQYGAIIATAEIVGCRQYQSFPDFVQDEQNHRIPCASSMDIGPFGSYAWKLANVRKLETPIPFKMPKGCVVWAKARLDL